MRISVIAGWACKLRVYASCGSADERRSRFCEFSDLADVAAAALLSHTVAVPCCLCCYHPNLPRSWPKSLPVSMSCVSKCVGGSVRCCTMRTCQHAIAVCAGLRRRRLDATLCLAEIFAAWLPSWVLHHVRETALIKFKWKSLSIRARVWFPAMVVPGAGDNELQRLYVWHLVSCAPWKQETWPFPRSTLLNPY